MKKGEISFKILKYLLIGGGLLLILSSPTGTRKFLKQLPKEFKKYRKNQVLRALYRLRDQNLIENVRENDKEITVKITDQGKNYLKKFDFENLSLSKPENWDNKWRLVIFDIPESKKLAREALREKLKDLGMKKLQHSIWITPFSCEKEINLIKIVFNLSDHWIDVIITENIGANEYKMRKYFNLI